MNFSQRDERKVNKTEFEYLQAPHVQHIAQRLLASWR